MEIVIPKAIVKVLNWIGDVVAYTKRSFRRLTDDTTPGLSVDEFVNFVAMYLNKDQSARSTLVVSTRYLAALSPKEVFVLSNLKGRKIIAVECATSAGGLETELVVVSRGSQGDVTKQSFTTSTDHTQLRELEFMVNVAIKCRS